MDLRRLRHTYDARAASYDRTVGLGERVLVGGLRRAFGMELRGAVLEVAVGSGLNLPFYGPAVERAVGLDLSGAMLARARARGRAEDAALPIRLVQGNAQRLPFPDGAFDTVAVSLALCTVPDPGATLQEMARVCRSGGRVLLLEHVRSPVPPVAWLQRLLSPVQERFIGCHLARETVTTLREAGFTVRSERRRLLGVFRLVVADPPPDGGGTDAAA